MNVVLVCQVVKNIFIRFQRFLCISPNHRLVFGGTISGNMSPTTRVFPRRLSKSRQSYQVKPYMATGVVQGGGGVIPPKKIDPPKIF
jgi:hypothetical protein